MAAERSGPHFIRPLTERDGPLFINFYRSLSEQTNAFFFPHDPSPESLGRVINQIPTDPSVARFMASAQEGGREMMSGYVFFWDWQKKVPWFGICVRDACQGRGLGRQMMNFAVDLARQRQKGGILLSVMKANLRAQALYKSAGFELLGEAPDGQFLMILRFDETETA